MSMGVEPGLDISSLIDVAFLLLIYFIVTTTLTKSEADLGMVLPGVASNQSTSVKVDQMVVKVAADQSVFVNDELVDSDPNDHLLPNLTDRLDRYAASAKIAPTAPNNACTLICIPIATKNTAVNTSRIPSNSRST